MYLRVFLLEGKGVGGGYKKSPIIRDYHSLVTDKVGSLCCSLL